MSTTEVTMGEAKRRRLAGQGGQAQADGADEAGVMAAAQEVGDKWLSIPANLRRVEGLEKGRWIDVNISGAEDCPPMVLRIESEQESSEVRTVRRRVRTPEGADAVVATAEMVAVA